MRIGIARSTAAAFGPVSILPLICGPIPLLLFDYDCPKGII